MILGQRRVGADRGLRPRDVARPGFRSGLVEETGLGEQRLGREVEGIGDRLQHPYRRLVNAAFDLAQVSVREVSQRGQFPQRELGEIGAVIKPPSASIWPLQASSIIVTSSRRLSPGGPALPASTVASAAGGLRLRLRLVRLRLRLVLLEHRCGRGQYVPGERMLSGEQALGELERRLDELGRRRQPG